MSHAEEREYTKTQAAIILCDYLRQQRGVLTVQKAMQLTGRGYFATLELLREVAAIVGAYEERGAGRKLSWRMPEDDMRDS